MIGRIDEYYLLKREDKKRKITETKVVTPLVIYETISPFNVLGINDITYDHVKKSIGLLQMRSLEDDPLNECCKIQLIFRFM